MNFQDYAFLRNHLDCIEGQDGHKMPAWAHGPVFFDIRNELRAQCQLFTFTADNAKVGDKYTMYVKQYYPCDLAIAITWNGDSLPVSLTMGNRWKRHDKYGLLVTMQTVYAENEQGWKWVGRMNRSTTSAVVMRRFA